MYQPITPNEAAVALCKGLYCTLNPLHKDVLLMVLSHPELTNEQVGLAVGKSANYVSKLKYNKSSLLAAARYSTLNQEDYNNG